MSEPQKTIEREAVLEGVGIHTGKKCSLKILPAAAYQGVVFLRLDLPGRPAVKAQITNLLPTRRRTALASAGARVETVEHFLATLFVLGVDNCLVEIDSTELPALDGSALPYYNLLTRSGTKELEAPREEVRVSAPVEVRYAEAVIRALPAGGLSVSYELGYPGIGVQETVEFAVDPEVFAREIAPARTFCLEEEIESLRSQGFGKGATEENTMVLSAGGPKGMLRFDDEPARHKVLDLLGDLFFLGGWLHGRIECHRSGHTLNRSLVEALCRQDAEGVI